MKYPFYFEIHNKITYFFPNKYFIVFSFVYYQFSIVVIVVVAVETMVFYQTYWPSLQKFLAIRILVNFAIPNGWEKFSFKNYQLKISHTRCVSISCGLIILGAIIMNNNGNTIIKTIGLKMKSVIFQLSRIWKYLNGAFDLNFNGYAN